MILNKYDYFLKITETGSISKAAEMLYITQPSLTKYLQRLEKELGTELFDRKTSPLRLTAAGEAFLTYVRNVTTEERKLTREIQEITDSGMHILNIGMALWRANVLLPGFLPGFYRDYPAIRVNLHEGPAEEMQQLLIEDKLDLSIMDLPISYQNVAYEPLKEERLFLTASRKNQFIRQFPEPQHGYTAVDINNFRNQPFVYTQPGQQITQFIDHDILAKNDMDLNIVIRTANVSTAVELAAADLGFAFVPELGIQARSFPKKELRLFEIGSPPVTMTLAIVRKKSTYISESMQIFCTELKRYCQEFN